MHTRKLFAMLVGLTVLTGLMTFTVLASPQMQGGNVLQDPTFDLAAQGTWKWQRWSYQVEVIKPGTKHDPDLDQSFYAPTFSPSDPKWDHTSGGTSGAAGSSSGQFGKKFRAGFYQTVQVGRGTRVRFSIWANEFCRYGDGPCPVLLKAGIDPTGGTDWTSGNIKWTAATISNNKYVQLVTEQVTAGDAGQVTVFTWGEPLNPGTNTAAYFDDAALTGATAPGAAPTVQTGQPAATAQPAACAQLNWVSDVTIPDGTAMAPGAQFVKTWRVKNAGTCAFTGTLNFVGKGNQMGGTSPVTLPRVEAGQEANVSVNLTAPTQAGDSYGTWQPRTADGTPMENLVVRIKVSAGAAPPASAVTATPALTATATPRPVVPTPTVPPTPAASQICVQAYNDLNGDGQQGADETLLAGVTFALADARGPKDSYTTDGTSEPHCFPDLALGNYQLTIKPPAGYGATTPDAMTVSLSAGVKPSVVFGAKRSGLAPAPTGTSGPSDAGAVAGGSLGNTVRTILIVIGVLVLIGLAAVGWFVWRGRRSLFK